MPYGQPSQDSSIEGLPSWTPNWKQKYHPDYLGDIAYRQGLLDYYDACGGKLARWTHHRNGHLDLEGIVVDEVVALCEIMPASHSIENNNSMLRQGNDFVLLSGAKPSDRYTRPAGEKQQDYVDAFKQTMCADIYMGFQKGNLVVLRECKREVEAIYPIQGGKNTTRPTVESFEPDVVSVVSHLEQPA